MNPLLLSQKNHYRQSVLPEILQPAVESYLLLSLASILLCSENPSKEWSENKQHSSFRLCHLWKIYLDDDHARARKEADHCSDTTVFAALANVKKKKIIFFTFEMSKFILGSTLQKWMKGEGGRMPTLHGSFPDSSLHLTLLCLWSSYKFKSTCLHQGHYSWLNNLARQNV